MSIITRATDTIYAYKFIRLMQKDFTEWTAFKAGIINDRGGVIKRPSTPEEKLAYTPFHASVRSMKRMMSTVPGLAGMASLAAAFSATAGRYGITESQVKEITDAVPDLKCITEEMVAGDSGGSTQNIASGVTTGSIVNKGLKVLGKRKSKVKRRLQKV
ncbi:hypothetical protein NCTGTJJY_CDS0027 [Serratia phage 92A1]|nr:hypothetical protein NCTGTJJY_CDS0027 [Serratia phage 92A1]